MKIKRIAVIAPSHLPIPNVKGGAIETLTTILLDENEVNNNFSFDIFSLYDSSAEIKSKQYKNSRYFFHKRRLLDWLLDFVVRIVFKLSCHRLLINGSFIRFVSRKIKNNQYDYLLIEGNFLQTVQFKHFNIPIIYHLHTDILNKDEIWTKKVVEACHKIFVISSFLKRRIEDVVGTQDKIVVFKNAIDTDLFKKKLPVNLSLRNELGIAPNNNVMIYCGRLTPIKGVLEALRAFKMANQNNLTFLIVGGTNFADSNTSKYEELLHSYSRTNKLDVVFTGYVPLSELPNYYSIADFSICPSICNEAAGLVIIEALACGLPVIASNVGGIPEYTISDCCELIDCNEDFEVNLSKAISKYNSKNNYLQRNEDISQFSKANYFKRFCNLI